MCLQPVYSDLLPRASLYLLPIHHCLTLHSGRDDRAHEDSISSRVSTLDFRLARAGYPVACRFSPCLRSARPGFPKVQISGHDWRPVCKCPSTLLELPEGAGSSQAPVRPKHRKTPWVDSIPVFQNDDQNRRGRSLFCFGPVSVWELLHREVRPPARRRSGYIPG